MSEKSFNSQSADYLESLEQAMALPSESQLEYHHSELAAFMHFGVNTFTGREWGTGEESPEIFNPENWNPDGMVKALKAAGFKRLIITAKHHDGFCLWFSKYTDHTVEYSPFKRDILADLSAACTKYGLDMGLYLSPWDAHEPSYGYGTGYDEATDSNGDYNEFYMNQIREICEDPKYGREGKFVEWWLDGAKGEGADAQEYKFEEWISIIKEHNPGINIFGAGVLGGIYWVGNENGYAPDPCWYTASSNDPADTSKLDLDPNGIYWSIPESDVSLYKGWFHHPGDEPKTQSELAYIYLNSIGRGSTLLLNIPPTFEGDFADDAYESLENFAKAVDVIKEDIYTFEDGELEQSSMQELDNVSIAFGEEEVSELTWTLPEASNFDLINIAEMIEFGQRVEEFSISIKPDNSETFEHIYHGTTIGQRRLVLLPDEFRGTKIEAIKIKFKLLANKSPLFLRELSVTNLHKLWKNPNSADPAPLPGVEPGDPDW